MAWTCNSFVDGLSKKCIDVHIKNKIKIKLISHDCLPIFVLLYTMLYIMPAYLMLSAALSNAVWCLMLSFIFLPLIFANALCLHALSWFIDT